MADLNLLGSTNRVETPYIKVTIGDFTFGVFDKTFKQRGKDVNGEFVLNNIRYPNYIQDLTVQKINGAVNKYTLNISYAITQNDDPNFFEKVFSSVSQTRRIQFSYGDMSVPSFVFKEEEGIILDVKKRINIPTSVIQYTVKAVSVGTLSTITGSYSFKETYDQPSNIIKKLLWEEPDKKLLQIFPGMSNRDLVEMEGLIRSDDIKVKIEAKMNISVLDYLLYLVDLMTDSNDKSKTDKTFYSLIVSDDTSGKFLGTYFRIDRADSDKTVDTAYEIDVGIQSKDIITSLELDDDETYSIYYNFSETLTDNPYVQRVNDRGEIEEKYASMITAGTAERITTDESKNWWNRVTDFPIKASITFKGLLRPAMLMTHIRLNIYFYGRKFIDSGLYIVTKEVDKVDYQGYRTTLNLLRIDKTDYEDEESEW